MTTTDELVRLRQAFAEPAIPAIPAMSAIRAQEPEACPPPGRIWLAVRGELPAGELRGLLDHVATCSACAEDWRIAMVFEEEARTTGAIPASTSHFHSAVARFRPWLVAAALTLMTVGGLQLYHFKNPGPEINNYRGDGISVESLLPEGASLSRQSFILPWAPVQKAESYNLSVSTSGLVPLFDKKGVTSTSFQVPASYLEHLRPGTEILWTVTPVFPDGSRTPGKTFHALVQ